MATGGAAELAGACGLPRAVRPLLWLALAEAAWIAGRALLSHRHEPGLLIRSWFSLGLPLEGTGELTVPLGLAVVTSGLSAQPGRVALALAATCLALSWMTMPVLVARTGLSLLSRRAGAADGGWFLLPAAMLGAGSAAGAVASHTVGSLQGGLRLASMAGAGLGVTVYWVVVAAAALDVRRRGIGQDHKVLWWISTGCGGLAAAAVGRALAAGGQSWPGLVVTTGQLAAGITWAAASLLAIPIVAHSIAYVVHNPRPVLAREPAPWTPTFSTAVFALGALATAAMTGASPITTIGKLAGAATLTLWVATTALNVARALTLGRRGRAPGRPGPSPRSSAP